MLWRWLNDFRNSSIDDSGPQTFDDLARFVEMKLESNHEVVEVQWDDSPVGVVSYQQLTFTDGHFRGICFAREVHGKGIPQDAVAQFLDGKFASGTQRVLAEHDADNTVIRTFLEGFGAKYLGKFIRDTRRNGQLVPCRRIAIEKNDFLRANGRRAVDQKRPHNPGIV